MQIRNITADTTLPIRHKVLWPNKPIEHCKVENDDEGLHFGVFENDQLVCVASVFIINGEARLRKFATLQAYQGRGLGKAMIQHILTDLKHRKVTLFWCDARESAIGFYTQFKMSKQGERFYKSDVSYFKMAVTLEH
ncbi:GNAT family acetyltransferase [Vibrio sp. UCD-FRSSP16_10]|uniref:GNAT family N-acetyltransferase n=1 Tax=unclassified Vibrio TaxID=2614977 RepID=UPI0007FE0F1E|nr:MULTISPECIES: GNAT family N-acetyltransferase [unclassified Vibrio]OBT13871.1 GNAT family acetyltransferase [Vibrio sp. UCD-FRSSP16_30]OBT22752.1 GNAT family acetyltransferase [Vibrio sp. UCD-FRSSP16_10]